MTATTAGTMGNSSNIGSSIIEGAKWVAKTSPIGVGIDLLTYSQPLGDGTLFGKPGISYPSQSRQHNNSRTKEKAGTTTKTADCKVDGECKNKEENSGRIQLQEDKETLVKASLTGSAWTNLPIPPSYALCSGYATNCRTAASLLKGADRGKKFQEGADSAYQRLLKWMKSKPTAGVPICKISFYFNSKIPSKINNAPKVKGIDSRRMDFDVLKGRALTT